MTVPPWAARLRALVAVATFGLAVAGCSMPHSGASPRPTPDSAHSADEQMPSAPRDPTAWLTQVGRIYDHADGGRSAEDWLRRRMAKRRPGERLAVLLGIDDVMLETHFGGLHTLVRRSVHFVRTAHALGYSVFYVTGRSSSSGLGQVESALERANVPANAFYGRPVGAPDEEAAKAQCRAAIKKQGYTLAMVVAASEASFDGSPRPEKEIRLPDFALRG